MAGSVRESLGSGAIREKPPRCDDALDPVGVLVDLASPLRRACTALREGLRVAEAAEELEASVVTAMATSQAKHFAIPTNAAHRRPPGRCRAGSVH